MKNDLLQLFPADRRSFWLPTVEKAGLQEIRLRADKPVTLLVKGRECFVGRNGELTNMWQEAYRPGREELECLLNHICHYSPYAYEDELRQGFLTVAGGHRVGIAGQVVLERDGGIRTIRNISYMNIRISHQIIGAADSVLPFLYEGGGFKNILIISPPGCGKTTLLRDLVRQVSDGNTYGEGKCVGLVDERSEIAGTHQGLPQNDIGMRTDVLDACPKGVGMMLLLRSMAPAVIAIDELGGGEEMEALRMASCCGVNILATAHGASVRDAAERFGKMLFDLFVVLGRENGVPVVRDVFRKEEAYASIIGRQYDPDRMSGPGRMVPAAVYPAAEGRQGNAGDIGDFDERDWIWKGHPAGMLQKSGSKAAGAIQDRPFEYIYKNAGEPGDKLFADLLCLHGGET